MRHIFTNRHLSVGREIVRLAIPPLLLLWGWFFLGWLLDGRPVQAERYPIKKYTAADGLAQNFVNRVVIDSRGYLWICTNEGFSRFDGYQFVSFGVEQGLPHRIVRDLIEAGDGQYWLATNGGLVRFNPLGTPTNRSGYAAHGRVPMFTFYRLPIDQQDRPVISLARGPAGTIWCGTGSGLFQLVEKNGAFTLQRTSLISATDDRYYVRSMLATAGATVWIGLSKGLIRYQVGSEMAERTEIFGQADGLPDMEISRIYQDRGGRIWAGTGRGLFELDPNPAPGRSIVRRQITIREGFPGDWVRDVWQMPDGDYWVATDRGLARFRLSPEGEVTDVRKYLVENGLSDYFLTCLMSGPDGNLWIGTANAGLMKWVYNGFTTYGESDGLASTVSVFRARDGRTVVAAYVLLTHLIGDPRAALVRERSQIFQWRLGALENGRFGWIRPNVPAPASFTSGWNQISFQDHLGDWWIPTEMGLYRFAAESLWDLATTRPKAVYTTREGLANNAITRLFEDSRGDIWISTSQQNVNHLDRWERATGRIVPISRGADQLLLQNRQVTAIAEDRHGTIWLGLSHSIIPGGLARSLGDRISLIDESQAPRGNIQSLIFDSTGRLWAASTVQGLIRLDDPGAKRLVFRYYGKEQGMLSNRVTSLAEDRYGRIYAGTARGLDQIDPASDRIHHFNQDDGLALGSVDDLYHDQWGELWIATTQGLSRFTPVEAPHTQAPPIFIDRLRFGGTDHPVSALGEREIHLPELPSGSNQIEIQYVGISFFTGDTLTYQTLIEGVDSDWVDQGQNRTINYVNLDPGSYRLRLRAVNAHGEASPVPALVTFRIASPFYWRWWFLLLVLAGSLGVGYLVISIRFRQKLRMERMRMQISADLHDEVGSSLSRIAIMTEVALGQSLSGGGVEQRDNNLRKVAEISRAAIDSMEEIVWAIDPRRDTLGDLVQRMRRFAGETLTMRGDIDLQFTAPPGDLALHVKVRRQVFLFFKEVVNNIVRHSGATAVRIEIQVDGRLLRLRVDDNGRGFSEAELPTERSGGNGLPGMRRRARLLGANVRIDSNPGIGTAVMLEVPLRGEWWRTYLNR